MVRKLDYGAKGGPTWEGGDRSHPDHAVVEGCDGRGEGKLGTFQGEALGDHSCHAAGDSFYLGDTVLVHQSLGSMTVRRIGRVAHASGSRRSRAVVEDQEGSLVEGSQVYGSPWREAAVHSRSTYHAEGDSSEGSRPPCMTDSLAAVGTPWRAEFCRSKGHHCGDDFRDAYFLRG